MVGAAKKNPGVEATIIIASGDTKHPNLRYTIRLSHSMIEALPEYMIHGPYNYE